MTGSLALHPVATENPLQPLATDRLRIIVLVFLLLVVWQI